MLPKQCSLGLCAQKSSRKDGTGPESCIPNAEREAPSSHSPGDGQSWPLGNGCGEEPQSEARKGQLHPCPVSCCNGQAGPSPLASWGHTRGLGETGPPCRASSDTLHQIPTQVFNFPLIRPFSLSPVISFPAVFSAYSRGEES